MIEYELHNSLPCKSVQHLCILGDKVIPNRYSFSTISRKKTWDVKKVKDVKILGLEDKRQIIYLVSSNASKEFLPPQLIL